MKPRETLSIPAEQPGAIPEQELTQRERVPPRGSTTAMTADELQPETIALTEKLIARLPNTGGIIAVGNLSPACEGLLLAQQLALTLQIITAKPVLMVNASTPAAPAATNRQDREAPGLTDVLRGAAALGDAIVATARAGLYALARGTDSPQVAELIVSSAYSDFITEAKERFHCVMIHCPSLLQQKEAASIIARADSLVLVAKSGQDRRRDVLAVRTLCAELKTDFLGVVLV
jgi:hypothetical protein